MVYTVNDMVEVLLPTPDVFLKIRETLTRIGVASKKEKTLFQSCHIFHKKGHYYIVMFKELFMLDGKSANFSESDIARRNTITRLLEEWGLLKVVDQKLIESPQAPMNQIKILPFKEKQEWNLISKYNIGKKRQISEDIDNDTIGSKVL